MLNKTAHVFKYLKCIQSNYATYHHKTSNIHKLSYVTGISNIPLIPDTIGQRLELAADLYEHRDSFVFSHSGYRLTFKTLKQKSEQLAAGLLSIGFQRGDRLGIWAPNCLEWILTQFATALIGVIQVNINPAYKEHELLYSLNKVKCKGIIMSEVYKKQNYVDIISNLCPELDASKPGELNSKNLPHLKTIIVASKNNINGFFKFDDVMNAGGSDDLKIIDDLRYKLQSSDPINIQYTSGTTGSPKGVTLSHHMILNNAYHASMSQDYHLKQTIICCQVPLYHCFGMVLGSLATICHGITCVLPSLTFNPEESLKAITLEKCTTLFGTPTMFIDLYSHPNFSKYDVSSLDSGVMSGSTCPVEVVNECIKKLNTKNIAVVYGTTETSPLITANSIHDSLDNRTQTIGRPMNHVEIKVVDSEGKLTKVNEAGELLVRGYNTMLAYWEENEKTNEAYTADRFYKTGDLVQMNEHGYFHHLGRLKDLVIRGGENIYPREIEEFLHEHPKIVDVYVIGVPDYRMGEELCACIKLAPNQKITAEELKLFCKDKIAHFKIPRYIEFMDDFPMTVTGKIQKNKLREIIAKKLGL